MCFAVSGMRTTVSVAQTQALLFVTPPVWLPSLHLARQQQRNLQLMVLLLPFL